MRPFSLLCAALLLVPAAASAEAKKDAPKPHSKIGIHLLVNYTPGAKKIIQANCPIIKILDCHQAMIDALQDYKRLHPEGIVILRAYTPNGYLSKDPKECARKYWSEVIEPQVRRLSDEQKKLIDYVEGPNEGETPCWGSVEDAKWFNTFWLTLAPIMAENGCRPCIGSIAVGNPPGEPDEVEAKIVAFIPALRLAKKLNGSWSYHAYTLKHTQDPAVEIYYSLRYRRFYDIFRKHAPDLLDLPIVLTEGGVDSDGSYPHCPGYKRDSIEKYQQWLMWFDSEIKKDSYVKGVTLFQIGDPQGWNSFDLEPIADWLADYLGE